MSRWIKSYESLVDSEVFSDAETFRTFWYLVTVASVKPFKYKGVTVKRGQYATSMRHLATQELHRSVNTVKKSLESLMSMKCIKADVRKDFTIYTVVNYSKYQGSSVSFFDTPSDTPNDTSHDSVSNFDTPTEHSVSFFDTSDEHLVSNFDTHNIDIERKNKKERIFDDVVVDARAHEDWKIEMIDDLDEQWMSDVSEELRIPLSDMKEWREEFKLKMKTEGSTSLTPHEHIKHFKNFLRNKKTIVMKENNRQRVESTKINSNEHRETADELIKKLLS